MLHLVYRVVNVSGIAGASVMRLSSLETLSGHSWAIPFISE